MNIAVEALSSIFVGKHDRYDERADFLDVMSEWFHIPQRLMY
jgi:hypothetical protein